MVHKKKLNWDSTSRAADFDMIEVIYYNVKIAKGGNSGISDVDEASPTFTHELHKNKTRKQHKTKTEQQQQNISNKTATTEQHTVSTRQLLHWVKEAIKIKW